MHPVSNMDGSMLFVGHSSPCLHLFEGSLPLNLTWLDSGCDRTIAFWGLSNCWGGTTWPFDHYPVEHSLTEWSTWGGQSETWRQGSRFLGNNRQLMCILWCEGVQPTGTNQLHQTIAASYSAMRKRRERHTREELLKLIMDHLHPCMHCLIFHRSLGSINNNFLQEACINYFNETATSYSATIEDDQMQIAFSSIDSTVMCLGGDLLFTSQWGH